MYKTGSKLSYFFLNEKLHRVLHINRPADIITAWSYPEHKRVGYTYSDVKKRYAKAFTTLEVCKMVNRKRLAVERAILSGAFERPQHTYGLATQHKIYKFMWAEQDIMNLHEYLSSLHYGRPRLDGKITPHPLPNARELRALIRHNQQMYVREGEEYVPVWQSKEL